MNKYGLTLIEVIISAVILSIAVAGVLFVFSTEKGVVARTGRKFQAMEFSRQTLEQLKDEVRADTWPGGDLSPGQHGTEDLTGKLAKFGGTRKYNVTDIKNGGHEIRYKSVTVTVKWTEPTEP